ncbi:MAG: zinc-ribbon domain-containing protein [Huintestinicola sp.]
MFEKFVETISNTGKAVGEKAKIGTDIAKISIKVSNEERALCDLYRTVGEKYYANNKENPCCDEMKALFDQVTAKLEEIETLKADIRRMKGVSVCQNCGAEVDVDNDFCGKCGAKVEKPVPAVVEEPAEEAAAEEAPVAEEAEEAPNAETDDE